MHWGRAWRSLRELLRDPDDTAKAIEVNFAIGARDFERSFRRFAASATGAALLEERPSLAAALSDRAALEKLGRDTLGHAYLEYLERTGFAPTGLVELQDEVRRAWEGRGWLPPMDPLRAWFLERVTLIHDLSHVVTGYPTDDSGEATLLVFAQAQAGGRGNGLLTAGATFEMVRNSGLGWLSWVYRVWRRGRRAVNLFELPWEELLPLRLSTVRRLARLDSLSPSRAGERAPCHTAP
jgi:ubiquinone biosynthesis protein COQ4